MKGVLFEMLLKRNVQLAAPLKKISQWRKTSLGVWNNACEGSIYSRIEVDATAMLAQMEKLKKNGHVISPTAFIGKAIATAVETYPFINSIIRFGRIYPRKGITLFFQVAFGDNGEDLSGLSIKNCENISLLKISEEIHLKSLQIKNKQDADFNAREMINKFLPGFFVKYFLKLSSFFLYTLNIQIPFFHDHDYFGSAMVTSLSMFNIDHAFVPLLPFTRCPIVVAVGCIRKKAVVDNEDKIVIKPILNICVTLDHRLVDGAGAGKLLKNFKTYLENPE